MKVPVGIEKVLYLAAVDPVFREALLADRTAALSREGVGLSADEASILKCIPDAQLAQMIEHIDPASHRKRFMQKVAACAVALAATTAGAGCKPGQGAGSAKDVGPAAKTAPLLTYKPKQCETEDADKHFIDAAEFGDQKWSWGTGGVLSDRPQRDRIEINWYGESGKGEIDRHAFMDVVQECKRDLEECLASPGFAEKDFFGDVDVALRVRKTGAPVEVVVERDDVCEPALTKCFVDILKKKRYPKPKSKAAQVHVSLYVNKVLDFDTGIEPRVVFVALETEGVARENMHFGRTMRYEILTACYRNALKKNKSLRGETKFRVALNPDGNIAEISTIAIPDGGDELARQIMPWLGREEFPKPETLPASVTLTLQFDFIPRETIDVALGEIGTTGIAEPAKFGNIVRSRFRSIQHCYHEARWNTLNLAGEIALDVFIDQDGRVSAAKATKDLPGTSAVSDCIISRLKHWRFPKPDNGVATVSFTIKSSVRAPGPPNPVEGQDKKVE